MLFFFIPEYPTRLRMLRCDERAIALVIDRSERGHVFFHGRQRSFVDVPIESCGSSSPMRVALQASAPDMLLILLRLVV